MESKKYKSLRLKHFDYSSDGYYFITICTFQKQKVIDNLYRQLLKRVLISMESRFTGMNLDYYVFMGNHCHIIIRLIKSKVGLSKIVQTFKSITAVKIRKMGFKGEYFWQKNYYEHVIRNDKELNMIREYVRHNSEKEKYLLQEKASKLASYGVK